MSDQLHHAPDREKTIVFVLIRPVTWAALFIGVLLINLPAAVLSQTGMVRPPWLGTLEISASIDFRVGVISPKRVGVLFDLFYAHGNPGGPPFDTTELETVFTVGA